MVSEQWSAVKNILCVRPDNLGDVLMTTPAIRALRQSFEGAKITLLTSQAGAAISRLIPEIDETLVVDVPWIRVDKSAGSQEVFGLVETLKGGGYDAAVIFTNFSQSALPSALLCYLADIPLRLGYSDISPNALLTEWLPDNEAYAGLVHGVERNLRLVASIGAETSDKTMSLRIPDDARDHTGAALSRAGIEPEKPFIVLHPGVSEDKRRYPEQLFIEAGKLLIDRLGHQIVVTGSSGEKPLADSVANGIGRGASSLAGEVSIPEFAAVLEQAGVVVSNNTGPVHMAAALETPVVDLYARTNPEHAPWMTLSRVLYFDVDTQLQTKSPKLLAVVPAAGRPMPKPEHILQAARELIEGRIDSELPKELTTWE